MTTSPDAKLSLRQHDAEAALSKLIAVMAALRDPETGCEWDVKQTHASISPYTIEEAYEVAEAIEHGTPQDLRDELGDLLLQVIFQARIAEEAEHFNFADIADSITAKMIRRHPHIFGDAANRTANEQRQAWEDMKAEERAAKKQTGTLDDVASTLPAMTRAHKLQKRAARVGFDWDDPKSVLGKVMEEMDEVKAELNENPINPDSLQGEIGDLLFSVINLARKSGIDPDQALKETNKKFVNRFQFIEKQAKAIDANINDVPLDQMEEWWQLAKNE